MFSQIKQLPFSVLARISISILFILGALHRFRGTWGWFSAVNAILLSIIAYTSSTVSVVVFKISTFLASIGFPLHTHLILLIISLLIGALYLLGESYGFGAWVGGLSDEDRLYAYNANKNEKEGGKYTGIQWLATKICPPTTFERWLDHCRIALFIRSFYWWFPFYLAFMLFDASFNAVIISSLVLAFAFPLACDIGRYTTTKWNFKFMAGGWEHQEVIYGAVQTLVFLAFMIFK